MALVMRIKWYCKAELIRILAESFQHLFNLSLFITVMTLPTEVKTIAFFHITEICGHPKSSVNRYSKLAAFTLPLSFSHAPLRSPQSSPAYAVLRTVSDSPPSQTVANQPFPRSELKSGFLQH